MNGKEADSYVINAEHLVFCKNHLPGKEPEKDCMDEYIKSVKKNKPSFAKPKIENQGPKQPTTLETVGKMKGIVSVLGCMFAPASDECKKLQSDQPSYKEDQEWNNLDKEGK